MLCRSSEYLEDLYKKEKKNNIKFNRNEDQIKNIYMKNQIKRICYSKEFLDSILSKNICVYDENNGQRKCSQNKEKNCDNNSDCIPKKNSEEIYKDNIKKIKSEFKKWFDLILIKIIKLDIILDDYFSNDKYFEKKNVQKLINFNPFDEIKSNDKWKWGLYKKCK